MIIQYFEFFAVVFFIAQRSLIKKIWKKKSSSQFQILFLTQMRMYEVSIFHFLTRNDVNI